VLTLLADGRRNTEIAVGLIVSDRTVDQHVSAIRARTRREAAAEAARLRLVAQR
jgi:DNA-binding CsgD family transcriptional regulator